MDTHEYIEQAFFVGPDITAEIEGRVENMSQVALDAGLHLVRLRQAPGLTGHLREAYEYEDVDEIDRLLKIAQMRAKDAVFRKVARVAVRKYSKIGEKRDWHL